MIHAPPGCADETSYPEGDAFWQKLSVSACPTDLELFCVNHAACIDSFGLTSPHEHILPAFVRPTKTTINAANAHLFIIMCWHNAVAAECNLHLQQSAAHDCPPPWVPAILECTGIVAAPAGLTRCSAVLK